MDGTGDECTNQPSRSHRDNYDMLLYLWALAVIDLLKHICTAAVQVEMKLRNREDLREGQKGSGEVRGKCGQNTLYIGIKWPCPAPNNTKLDLGRWCTP